MELNSPGPSSTNYREPSSSVTGAEPSGAELWHSDTTRTSPAFAWKARGPGPTALLTPSGAPSQGEIWHGAQRGAPGTNPL